MNCRFCSADAVAKFFLPAGCLCYPEDRSQYLCMQHVVRASPVDGMALIYDFTRGHEFTKWWRQRNGKKAKVAV